MTLFVHPPTSTTAPLRVFNLVRTGRPRPDDGGPRGDDAARLVRAVLVFFRVFGTRYLKGTYLI